MITMLVSVLVRILELATSECTCECTQESVSLLMTTIIARSTAGKCTHQTAVLLSIWTRSVRITRIWSLAISALLRELL